MWEERMWDWVPSEDEKQLLQRKREAKREGDREALEQCKKELVRLYVYHGEHFKKSELPDYRSAQIYLKKALRLDPHHPIANYRYAHLLFRENEHQLAAYHFKKALDGNRETGLNNSQTLVSQMMLVNCGLLMAKEAYEEVDYLQGNKYLSFDSDLIDTYKKMLVHSEELLEKHNYCHTSPEGTKNISREEFLEYQDRAGDHEVLLIVDNGYHIKYRNHFRTLEYPAFCVFWRLVRENDYVSTEEIASTFGENNAELELRYDNIRKHLSRLNQRIPYWEEVIETSREGTKRLRRRREGVTYALLCHSEVVLP